KRHCPNIAVIFGKARRTFEFRGHTIPAGWNVMMAIRENNLDPSVFAKPLELDPDRFSPERREHEKSPHAYVPQGAGPADGHRCAGEDLSTLIMSVFGAILVRGYMWELPPQDLSLRWDVVPPEPRDGLRAVLRARA
ncbi:MAG: cytochrome P450, partial [Deltaproteobacteria bacterium]|nr:cytochrome P450 [Deltaproteobacteria bacterium]